MLASWKTLIWTPTTSIERRLLTGYSLSRSAFVARQICELTPSKTSRPSPESR